MDSPRKEQKLIAKLGPIGFLHEAFELFSSHLKFFMCVQILLMLPFTILGVTMFEHIYSLTPTTLQRSRTSSSFADIVQRHSRRLLAEDPWGPPPNEAGELGELVEGALGFGIFIASFMLLSFLYEAAVSLPSSVTLYAVGRHYAGQSVSFQDALRASWKGLWMRLVITSLCGDLFFAILCAAALLVTFLGLLVQDRTVLISTCFIILWLFIIVVRECIDVITMLAAGASVLDNHLGWAALSKSRKLLEGRIPEAVLFDLLLWVPAIIVAIFRNGIRYQDTTTDSSSPGSMTAEVLLSVVYIGLRIFFWQLTALCSGVMYVSFKAYHKEDLAESVSKGGFEFVASEKDDFVQSV